MVQKKNYSFYMPTDFVDRMEEIQSNDDKLRTLSRSQALYFIISELAEKAQPASTESSASQ